jgi:predicted enzyme related to lactoylglutathione lyase
MSITPSRFVRHDLMCTDIPAVRGFYSELFDWRTSEVKVMGSTIIRLSAGEQTLGAIIPLDRSFGHPSHWVPYVYVDSVEACCKQATALGGAVCFGATEIPPGTFAMVNDPQKALFSPFTPRGGLPAEPAARPGVGEFCWDQLLTSDVAAARTFYTTLFGWETQEWGSGANETYTLFLRGDRPIAGAMTLPDSRPQQPTWLSYVSVADADATAARARELGGKVLKAPTDLPDVGRFAALLDPTGASLAILGGNH